MDGCKAIVAIDFGTSNIGFAYSFLSEDDVIHLATDNSNIQLDDASAEVIGGSTQHEEDVALVSAHASKLKKNRVPSVLLLNADGTINAFGKPAVDRYAQLVLTKRHQGYRYYDTFKIELYKKFQSILALKIKDQEGRKMSSLTMFAQVIRYVGKLALQTIREVSSNATKVDISPDSVLWVLTVPAVWSDISRQFLRQAAEEAGIPRKRLRLAREPEAAAIFWKRQMQKSANEGDVEKVSVGRKYIIADLGGGTTDVCAHEILPNDRFRELIQATGNTVGGKHVDSMFILFMRNLVTERVWKIFHRQLFFDFVKLMRIFEEQKKRFDHETEEFIIDLPSSLIRLTELSVKSSFEDVLKGIDGLECVNIENNRKLHIKREIIKSFFKPSLDGIVEILENMLKMCNSGDKINTLLIAGGFSMSPYVSEEIKRVFSSTEVIKVPEQDMAVLKGAVMMGYEPDDIVERRSRYAYGFAVARPFRDSIHPKRLKFIRDGTLLCRDIFHKLISKNQLLRVGDRYTLETRNNDRKYYKFKERESCAQLFYSTLENPAYCTDEEGCIELFITKIESPKNGWSERLCIDYTLVVGDTDFEVEAFDIFTGRKFETRKEIM